MEEFYYQKMGKQQQTAYHNMLKGVRELADEIQLPQLDGESLYWVFFQMRLDHPEVFWLTGYKYKYYKDSPNLIGFAHPPLCSAVLVSHPHRLFMIQNF